MSYLLAKLSQCILNSTNGLVVNEVYVLQNGKCTIFANDSGKQAIRYHSWTMLLSKAHILLSTHRISRILTRCLLMNNTISSNSISGKRVLFLASRNIMIDVVLLVWTSTQVLFSSVWVRQVLRLQPVLSHTLGTTMCELKYFVLQRKLVTRFYGTANVTMLWQILR